MIFLRKLIREVLSESENILTLYHGSNDENFEKYDKIFLSTDMDFAKSYGNKLFEVLVDVGNVFDSTNIKYIRLLYDNGFKLTDPYIEKEEDDDIEGYDFENNYYTTPKSFAMSKYNSTTWNPIEKTKGVIDWIFNNGFDSILITEDGVKNYLVKTKYIIKINQI